LEREIIRLFSCLVSVACGFGSLAEAASLVILYSRYVMPLEVVEVAEEDESGILW